MCQVDRFFKAYREAPELPNAKGIVTAVGAFSEIYNVLSRGVDQYVPRMTIIIVNLLFTRQL